MSEVTWRNCHAGSERRGRYENNNRIAKSIALSATMCKAGKVSIHQIILIIMIMSLMMETIHKLSSVIFIPSAIF